MARTKGSKNHTEQPPKEVLNSEEDKLQILADILFDIVSEELSCKTN